MEVSQDLSAREIERRLELQGRDPSPMMNRLIELTPALGTLFQPPPGVPKADTKEMEDRILEALRPFLRELVGKS